MQFQEFKVPNNIEGGPKEGKLRTATALDEIVAIKLLGQDIDMKKADSSAFLQFQVLVLLSILEEDGVRVEPPQSMDEVYYRLGRFSRSAWNKVQEVFTNMNKEENDPNESAP